MADTPDGAQLRAAGVEDWLASAVERIARGDPTTVESYLCSVGHPAVLPGTVVTARTHFVQRDGNGRPRILALARKLADQVVDYCIPRTRIQEAMLHMQSTGSAEKFAQLNTEARKLFTTLAKSGEAGELLLYFMLEVALQIPQILCKMSLKTSTQMHYHGTDGVHAKVDNDGSVALYWGEAKLYASVNAAIDACFESISPFFRQDEPGVAERDLLLIRDNIDLGADDVTDALVGYFVDDDPKSLQLSFRGACLIGFDLEDYPSPFETDGRSVRQEVTEAIGLWHSRIASRIQDRALTEFHIEVFCVPFPSVQEFRDAVREQIGAGS